MGAIFSKFVYESSISTNSFGAFWNNGTGYGYSCGTNGSSPNNSFNTWYRKREEEFVIVPGRDCMYEPPEPSQQITLESFAYLMRRKQMYGTEALDGFESLHMFRMHRLSAAAELKRRKLMFPHPEMFGTQSTDVGKPELENGTDYGDVFEAIEDELSLIGDTILQHRNNFGPEALNSVRIGYSSLFPTPRFSPVTEYHFQFRHTDKNGTVMTINGTIHTSASEEKSFNAIEQVDVCGSKMPDMTNPSDYVYHYTNKAGAMAICKSGFIKKSTKSDGDTAHGEGVYFTGLLPNNSDDDITLNNWGQTEVGERVEYYVAVPKSYLQGVKQVLKLSRDYLDVWVYPDNVYNNISVIKRKQIVANY